MEVLKRTLGQGSSERDAAAGSLLKKAHPREHGGPIDEAKAMQITKPLESRRVFVSSIDDSIVVANALTGTTERSHPWYYRALNTERP